MPRAPSSLLSDCAIALASWESGGAVRVEHAAHEQIAARNVRTAPRRPAIAIRRRAFANQPREAHRERTEAGEANQHTDLGYGQIGDTQQVLCALDASTGQVTHGRLAVDRSEATRE